MKGPVCIAFVGITLLANASAGERNRVDHEQSLAQRTGHYVDQPHLKPAVLRVGAQSDSVVSQAVGNLEGGDLNPLSVSWGLLPPVGRQKASHRTLDRTPEERAASVGSTSSSAEVINPLSASWSLIRAI